MMSQMTRHNNSSTLPYYSATSSPATMSVATSPINCHTNSVAVDKDPVLSAWQRYERLKANENEKNTLIEVIFFLFWPLAKTNHIFHRNLFGATNVSSS
jgi:hypothetical protein